MFSSSNAKCSHRDSRKPLWIGQPCLGALTRRFCQPHQGDHYEPVLASCLITDLTTQASLALTVCYQLSFASTKTSILVLYLRILTYRFARHITYALLAVVVIYNVFGFVAELTTCVPLEKLWDKSVEGICQPDSFLWAIIGMHIATDFLIFFLPLPIFFSIAMPIRMKVTLLVLFGLGFL